jgi:FkbM family methyltransferase
MTKPAPSQEELIWEHFGFRRDGWFVEVGTNHPTEGSLTWMLEQKGWRGILIEPQERLFRLIEKLRPRSRGFRVACSSPESTGESELHIPEMSLDGFATLVPHVDDLEVRYVRTERVPVATLDSVLAEPNPPQLDLVIIDTEGTELDVLRGFTLEKHRPGLVLIEDKGHSLDKHRHLRAHGYRLFRRTELNNWYVPADAPQPRIPLTEKLLLWRKVFLGLPIRKFRHWRRRRRLNKSK